MSYSFANPYPSVEVAEAGYDLNPQLSAEFAVAADMNPGTPELLMVTTQSTFADMRKANSPNHGGDGQNVLYGDGHVSNENNPFVGIERDNIYIYGLADNTTGIVGLPASPDDSVLLPTALKGPTPPAIAGPTLFQRWVGPSNAIILAIAIALIIWAIRSARDSKATGSG